MSADLLADVFLHATRLGNELDNDYDQWLRGIVREVLAESATTDSPAWSDATTCPLASIGDFLLCTTRTLSQLANRMTYGDHIEDYAKGKIQEDADSTDFSEHDFIFYLDKKHESLKFIAANLQSAAEQTEQYWTSSPKPPPRSSRFQSKRPSLSGLSNVLPISPNMSSGYSDRRRQPAWSSDQYATESTDAQDYRSAYSESQEGVDDQSPESHESVQPSIHDPFERLESRGKGHHICHYGTSCKKGGVNADGELIVFERNSAFKAHLQKHEKMFKCDIPGCTNKVGFARKDQLQRHKASVSHR